MPATTQLEILEGKLAAMNKRTNALSSTPTPVRTGNEAGGHHQAVRIMRCQNCGALSYIEYDPDLTREYNCSHCSVANTL